MLDGDIIHEIQDAKTMIQLYKGHQQGYIFHANADRSTKHEMDQMNAHEQKMNLLKRQYKMITGREIENDWGLI